MSSDSDEPLSALKEKAPAPSTSQEAEGKVKKSHKRKKKKVKKLKLALRAASHGRNVRYYASQAEVERPQDVWLYMKDLNPTGPYSCLLCTEWFINKMKLVVHYVLNHKKDYCGICRYFVENRETWVLHSEFHTPMTCSQCPKQFPSDSELRAHFAREHLSVHCRFCCFMMPVDQYNHHLFQKHAITNVANKDEPVLWDTEYDGSPKFSCLLCLKSGTPAIDFVKHYMAIHRFTLKCFTAMLSGFDVPFSVCGANISSSFLENALKDHAKVGYVDRDRALLESADSVDGNFHLLQALIPEIKQENSDAEEKVQHLQPVMDSDDNVKSEGEDKTPKKKKRTPKSELDPILNYKGDEDFDITLTELIVMNKSYSDYLADIIKSLKSNIVPFDSNIAYNGPNAEHEVELSCAMCAEVYPNLQALCIHMMKMHSVKTVPTYFCRLCVATFDNEAEFRTHMTEELAEFDDLWLCQFCDMEFDCRENSRKHLSEHWSELRIDNCFSPHLGYKCRYCPTLFWNETDREGHQNRAHLAKHKEDFYRCVECLKMFSDKIWFVYHCLREHPAAPQPSVYMMKCAVCCSVFPSVDGVKVHFASEHPEAKKIFCSLGSCKLRPFSQNKSFRMHLQTFHGRAARPQEGVSCIVCAREFPSARACSAHTALAHGPGRFKCKLCGDTLQSSDERKLHFMLQHPGQNPYECNLCGKTFQNKSSLYLHRSQHVNPERQSFTCKYCGKHFLKKDSFREHVLIHEGPRHTCSYCPMTFVQRSNMLRHERRHTGERPYTCLHCGRAFSDKGACNSHMRIHTPHEVHPCPYCGRTFAQKSKLRYHIRKHTGENLETCHVCSKLFTSVYSLREHMKTHEKGPESKCPICGRKFSSERYFVRHVRTAHGGDADTLECPLCERTSASVVGLRAHVMTHSKVKHIQCRMCPKSVSCRKTMMKHLLKKHGIKGSAESLKSLFNELDPRQCELGLDEERLTSIYGPPKNKINDVQISDYFTFPKNIPVGARDSNSAEDNAGGNDDRTADGDDDSDDNDEGELEEEPVSEDLLMAKKRRKKIRVRVTYEYEDAAPDKKKKHKKKKKRKKSKRREMERKERKEGTVSAEAPVGNVANAGSEAAKQNSLRKEEDADTDPTAFLAVKLEPEDDDGNEEN